MIDLGDTSLQCPPRPQMTPPVPSGHTKQCNLELEAELSLAGSLLLGYGESIVGLVEPEYFSNGLCRKVFTACRKIREDGGNPDPVSVANIVGKQVGLAELSALTNDVIPGESHCKQWAKIITTAADKRRIISVLRRAISDADAGASPEELRSGLVEALKPVAQTNSKKLFSLSHISKVVPSPPDWLIRDFLETDSLAVLFGDPGCGKSLAAIDLACCIATGTPFHGLQVAARPSPVLFIAGEGHRGLRMRFMAWGIRHQVNLDNAPLFISGTPAALLDPSSVEQVMSAIDDVAKEHGAPGLIIVDTVARNFGPGDENSTSDMGRYIQAADLIRSKYRSTVLSVHHTGHGDKTRSRGSIALKGAIDFEYRLTKDEDGIVRLDPLKIKDHEPPPSMAFCLRPVELHVVDDDGRPVTSAILDSTGYEPPPKAGKAGRGRHQMRALGILRELLDCHQRNLEEQGHSPDGARVTVAEWKDACKQKVGLERNRFSEVKKSLEEHSAVLVENGFVFPV